MITTKKTWLGYFRFIANYFVLIFFILINASSAYGERDLSALVEQVTPSVVFINVFDSRDELIGIGSGFFIEKEGLLVTNYHVIENGVKASARLSTGEFVPINEILAEDKEGDLVLLTIDVMGRSFPALKLTETGLKAGQPVVVIGSPFGLVGTVSDGIISAIRDIPNFGKILQISAPISEGSSGSPVLNMKGEVIGVASATIIGGQSLNFAIPADRVSKMVKEYPKKKVELKHLQEAIEEIRKKVALDEIQKRVDSREKVKDQSKAILYSDPIPIILPKWKSVDRTPPSMTLKAYEILVNDLTISGSFRVIDYSHLPPELQGKEGIPSILSIQEWMPTGGEILLVGETSLESDGLKLRLKFHLFDLVEQKRLIGKQYEGQLQTLQDMVHRIADEVVFQLTGKSKTQ
jgi:hypothetical protein